MKEYCPLGQKTAIDYVKNCPEVKDRFSADAEMSCTEVGDGNLNLVFIISNEKNPSESVVLKQALPYLRCAGEGWPLGRQRMEFESRALEIEGRICPGLVPELYVYDAAMSLVIMEHLAAHQIMRKGLIAGVEYPKFAGHMSEFLSKTLFETSDLGMDSAEKKGLVEYFARNTELCKLTEDFVFTNPFMESDENRWNPEIDGQVQAIRANSALKLEIAELKDGFIARAQALIHGDLHTGSVLLNHEETRVIDPEFAFYGPMGFDVGAVLGNLALAYCSHEIHSADESSRARYHGWLLDTIREIWNGFYDEFMTLWKSRNSGEATRPEFFSQCGGEKALDLYRRRYMRRLLQDTAGYGGCKMMRRQLGIAHVEDMECIENPKDRAIAESLALAIGARFIMERHAIESIDDMIDIIKSTKAPYRRPD